MKRTLIALAVAATIALPVAAQAAPKVYGKMNLTVENVDDDLKAEDRWEVRSNKSRFGVKGEDELTASLSAVYQIEWEVDGAGNESVDLAQRNRYVGIKSMDIGALKLGKYDSYLKQTEGKVDQFNDLEYTSGDMNGVLTGQNRVNNIIGYESPKIADMLTINVGVMPGEGGGVAGKDNGLADHITSSVVLDMGDFYLALGYDKDMVSKYAAIGTFQTALSSTTYPASAKSDTLRLVGVYSMGDTGLTLGALYQTSERSDTVSGATPKEDGFLVSAAYALTEEWKVKAQYVASTTELDTTRKDVDLTQMSVGVDYNFTKKTLAYAFYTMWNASNDNNPATGAVGVKTRDYDLATIGLGLNHSF